METIVNFVHITAIALFTLLILSKTFLLLQNKIEKLEKLKRDTRTPEVFVILIGIISLIWLKLNGTAGNEIFFWIKVALLGLAVPIGVNAFRYHKKLYGPAASGLLLIASGMTF
jgi:hypothetical protein